MLLSKAAVLIVIGLGFGELFSHFHAARADIVPVHFHPVRMGVTILPGRLPAGSASCTGLSNLQ